MTVDFPSVAPAAVSLRAPEDRAARILAAASSILATLEGGKPLSRATLRDALSGAFQGTDAEGAWSWKDAYESCEVAQVLFLRKYGRAMRDRASGPEAQLAMLTRLADLIPTQTRRTGESHAFQQFSTPLPLAFVAAQAAGIGPKDVVLEPSAGTGMLALFADLSGARLVLNEAAETRAALLRLLFPDALVSSHDAAAIDDRLAGEVRPSVVLMNPPFSAALRVAGRVAGADVQHLRSALARLPEGGRLVAITGHDVPVERFPGTRFTCVVDGSVYAKHGTTFETRLTVIDKGAEAGDVEACPTAGTVADLLAQVLAHVPPRGVVAGVVSVGAVGTSPPKVVALLTPKARPIAPSSAPEAVELAYEPVSWEPNEGSDLTDALYEPYTLQSIRIPGARSHPTPLVQSAAMASVAPPHPTYRPHLPERLVTEGVLSDAQLESVILAGDAHAHHLAGHWLADETFDTLHAASEDTEGALQFRRGWFLGDGTGCGKGRQVAAIILDNWIKGRRKALWISKSDKLIEDAQRDWAALGMERLLVQPLSRFKQGTPIRLTEGILFCTYATLRSAEREGKASRLQQVRDWLGADFDGVIIFDEAHALANAAGGRGGRGEIAPSQQGRAGLRLQRALSDARIVYVSATGATDVRNLAYAERLGLWGGALPSANAPCASPSNRATGTICAF